MDASDRAELIASWVGDFCASSAYLDHPSLVREYAPEALTAFLDVAKRSPEGSVALGWGRGSFGGPSGFRLPMDPRPKTEVMTDLLYV